MSKLKIYTVEKDYIYYLHSIDKKVMLPDGENYEFDRKYVGIVFTINNINYFAPLSSPKDDTDYIDVDGIKTPRKSTFTIIRLFDKQELIGKVLLNNMIPVPIECISLYDVENEQDEKYQSLVKKDISIIESLSKTIKRNAEVLYKQKINGVKNKGYIKATVDFAKVEKAMKKYNP